MNEDGAGRLRVLIVDDHEVVAQSLAMLLGVEDGIEVVGRVGSAADGLSEALARRPDVVLMDQRLPDGRGTDVALRIKEQAPEVKVVMLTGQPDEETLLEAIEAGCSGFISKAEAAISVVDGVRLAAAGEALIDPGALGQLLPKLRRRSARSVGDDLTNREVEVLELLAQGASTERIAAELFLSVHTVRNHVQAVLSKLGVHSKLEAVASAVRHGIVRVR